MWIVVAVASHFLYAVVALVDKYLLSGPLPSPKTYAFYVGVLGGAVALLLAVLGFVVVPAPPIIALGLLGGMMRTLALFALFYALFRFEASRVIPALGAVWPLVLLLFVLVVAGDTSVFLFQNFLAFVLLVVGTVGITFVKDRRATLQSVAAASMAAFLGASSFFFSKFAYDVQPFLSGLAWLLAGAFLMALAFLLSDEVRSEAYKVFSRRAKSAAPSPKAFPLALFAGNQAVAAAAAFLQNLAVALVPFGLLSFVGALGGIEYLFVFVFALFLSRRFPSIVREEVSRNVVAQKVISIALIAGGLIALAL